MPPPNGNINTNGNKQNYIAIGLVVAVLIALFTLSNLVPFVYKTEFADFKATMIQNFADIKVGLADSRSDSRDLRTTLENLKLQMVTLDAKVTSLQNRLDTEDIGQVPLPPLPHKKKKVAE